MGLCTPPKISQALSHMHDCGGEVKMMVEMVKVEVEEREVVEELEGEVEG